MTDQDIIHHLQDRANEAAEEPRKAPALWLYYLQLEKTVAECKERLRTAMEEEIPTYGKMGADLNGFNVKLGSSTKWDFTGVTEWVRMKEELKAVEEIAKLANKNQTPMPDKNGSVIEPAKDKRTTTIVCTKLKQ